MYILLLCFKTNTSKQYKKIETNKKGNILRRKILILILLFCLSSVSLLGINVNAQSNVQNDDSSDVILAVDGDKDIPTFEDVASQPSPKWFILGPTLAQAENDFEHISLDEVYKAYRNSGVQDYPINEEKYMGKYT